MIPVAANDVAFSIHAVLLTAITLFQILIYEVSSFWLLLAVSDGVQGNLQMASASLLLPGEVKSRSNPKKVLYLLD